MEVLRPVPTFEQVIRIPDSAINLPERVPEVSRPDPNLWDEHEDAVRARSVMVARLRVHDHETREASHATGVRMDVIRSVMTSAASMAHSEAMEDAMSDISSMGPPPAAPTDAPAGAAAAMPAGGYGPRNQGRLFDGIRAMCADMHGFTERTARAG